MEMTLSPRLRVETADNYKNSFGALIWEDF